MMSITSICITLCAVATVVTANPQGTRERLENASEGNGIKGAVAALNATQLALLTVDELSNLADDEDVAIFAWGIVKKTESDSYGIELYKKKVLTLPPGYQRKEFQRIVMNLKVFIEILSGFYKGSENRDFIESSYKSKEINEATQLKVTQAHINGLIRRLEPKPCLKEFVAAFFDDGESDEMEFSGASCKPHTVYASEWYRSSCRDVMEGSSEETNDVSWMYGPPTGEEGDDAEDVGSGPV